MDKKLHGDEPRGVDRRHFVAGAAVVGASLAGASALVGCGGGSGNGGGTGGGTGGNILSYYINQPAFIDPFNLQESEGTQVTTNIFDSLLAFDYKAGKLIGAAAESWEVSPDATVFTFKLRQGATFHNGDPVTAADFKYGWERLANPNTTKLPSDIPYHIAMVDGFDAFTSGAAAEITGLKAIDELTFEVTLADAYADFEYVCIHPALAPIPSGGAAADFDTFSRAPIGNGPFQMDGEWVDSQYIRVKRFDNYYGDKAILDGVDFKIISSPETAFTEFQAGNLDFTMIPNGQVAATVAAYGESPDGDTINPGQQTLLGDESSVYYLCLNNKDAVMSNKEVRKAISYAINRDAICQTLFEGTRAPASGIVPPGIDGFRDGAWPHSLYDVEKAKKTLADAGFADGAGIPTIKLSFNTGGGHEDIMQMIQADLKVIGINAELDSMEWAVYLDQLEAGQIQSGRLGWIADYPIMDNFLFPLFYTDNGDNHAHYSNTDVDKKIMAARSITDRAARIKAMQEVDDILGEDSPVIPIMFYKHNRVGSSRVKDFYFNPSMFCELNKVSLV